MSCVELTVYINSGSIMFFACFASYPTFIIYIVFYLYLCFHFIILFAIFGIHYFDIIFILFLVLSCISQFIRSSYSLNIQAADLGNPQQRASRTYTVAIQDENDNSPIFTPTTYRGGIKENSAIGKSVLTVRC